MNQATGDNSGTAPGMSFRTRILNLMLTNIPWIIVAVLAMILIFVVKGIDNFSITWKNGLPHIVLSTQSSLTIPKLLDELDNRRNDIPISAVKERFELYSLDSELIQKIRSLSFKDAFSDDLRDVAVSKSGPFKAPEVVVQITFRNNLENGVDSAYACVGSSLHNETISVLKKGETSIITVKATDNIEIGCDNSEIEPLYLSIDKGMELVGESFDASVTYEGIAKACILMGCGTTQI